MVRWYTYLIQALVVALYPCEAAPRGYGIPGTTQTEHGYDTEHGTDAICWTSTGSAIDTGNRIPFPNPLIAEFDLLDRIYLLSSCPEGNKLIAEAPQEFLEGERLRVEEWYNFSAVIQLNTTSLVAEHNITDYSVVSDDGPRIAAQIMACHLSTAGFCSPFKHEESNARAAAENRTEDIQQGDSHGGSHVHSGYQFLELHPLDGPVYNVTFNIPMIVNPDGDYFLIAAVQLFFRDSAGRLIRFDVANALPIKQRIMKFYAQPTILRVSTLVRVCAYIANAVVTCIIGLLLWQTVKHRDNQVMKLTQGNFLIIYLVAAMVVTSASIMFDPRSDLNCRFGGPVLLISAQVMYAVMLGRLWRINAVISPLLSQTIRQRRRSNLFSWSLPRRNKLRKAVNWEQLAVKVAMFVGPQVLIQLGALFLQPAHQGIMFNKDQSVGREYCTRDASTWVSFSAFGYICFALMVLVLLMVAHQTRALPSLFNETRDIFDSTLGTVVVLIIGVGISQAANSPDSPRSPAVNFLIGEVLVLTSTLNATIRVVMPKLRMIWRGETVLVSKLMHDHKQQVMKKDKLYMKQRTQKLESAERTTGSHNSFSSAQLEEFSHGEEDDSCGRAEHGICLSPIKLSALKKFVVKRDEAPSRTVFMKMMNTQALLTQVTERVISGSPVPEEEWIDLRRTCHEMSTMFHDQIEFHWERNKNEESFINQIPEEYAICEVPSSSELIIGRASSEEKTSEFDQTSVFSPRDGSVGSNSRLRELRKANERLRPGLGQPLSDRNSSRRIAGVLEPHSSQAVTRIPDKLQKEGTSGNTVPNSVAPVPNIESEVSELSQPDAHESSFAELEAREFISSFLLSECSNSDDESSTTSEEKERMSAAILDEEALPESTNQRSEQAAVGSEKNGEEPNDITMQDSSRIEASCEEHPSPSGGATGSNLEQSESISQSGQPASPIPDRDPSLQKQAVSQQNSCVSPTPQAKENVAPLQVRETSQRNLQLAEPEETKSCDAESTDEQGVGLRPPRCREAHEGTAEKNPETAIHEQTRPDEHHVCYSVKARITI